MSLLSIENLTVTFGGSPVIRDISLSVDRGEIVGLVGESGSGKSMTSLATLRLIPEPGKISAGKILLDGVDILALPEKAMRGVRGGKIAMIFQDPMTSLNPVFSVGDQIAEAVKLHRNLSGAAAKTEVVDALRRVKIPDPERRARQFPHELSGGMRQRVMIAMALACQPDILLADEPTTALDVTVQAQILALIHELRESTGMGVLFITHDLGVVAEICDRVVVLYGGQIMETGTTNTIFHDALHPYTRGLLRSLPESLPPGADRLESIPGQPPVRAGAISGCPFQKRCSLALPECARPLPTIVTQDSDGAAHTVRCHRVERPIAEVSAHV